MLRGRSDIEPRQVAASTTPPPAPTEATGFPARDQAYATGERPAGVLFYQTKESFWLPYHLLQTMQCQPDRVVLTFATDEVVLLGRGLHELFVHLARQTVWRIVEQGERYAEVSEAAVLVTRIDRTPVTRKEQQQGNNEAV